LTQRRGILGIPYRAWLLIALLIAIAISAIDLPHPRDFLFEHILTALLLAGLIAMEFRPPAPPLSNLAYTWLFLYLLLHVLGAHYTYSEVPYDRWAQNIFGTTISDLIGAGSYRDGGDGGSGGAGPPRNHYDRLVHFCFGLLILRPTCELVQRWLGLRGIGRVIVAASFLCVLGTLYELLEWIYAMVMGQEAAEHYNGQQGDMFDGQKDLAMNILGSTISGTVLGIQALRRRQQAKKK
jgi:putative membrane protein